MSLNVEYSWSINSIEYKDIFDGFNNYIIKINAAYMATYEGNIAQIGITQEYTPNQGDTIIPLEQVLADKNIVIGWLESSVNMESLTKNLYNQIYRGLNPETIVIDNPYNS